MLPPVVQEKSVLIANGKTMWHSSAREILIKLFETGLAAVNPYNAVKNHVIVTADKIAIKSQDAAPSTFFFNEIGNIYVVGGGKATAQMAVAIEELLGDRITAGFINIPEKLLQLDPPRLKRIKVTGASHPIPNQAGVVGVRKMIDLSQEARSKDLVICLISGGGSALMPQPASGITLEDKQVLNKLLIDCGASINEINVVRKHVSMVKGGWLARHFQPARVIGLILSDVVGDDISTIASGPTAPDPSTFSQALGIVDKYNLLDRVPVRVRKQFVIGMREEARETPKPEDKMFRNVLNIIIGSARTAAEEIRKAATSFTAIAHAHVLTNRLEGDAAATGKDFNALLLNIFEQKTKVKFPSGGGTFFDGKTIKIDYGKAQGVQSSTLLLMTGEMTVKLKGSGTGGRNQEMLLSLLCDADSLRDHRFAMLGCGMDGIEGNSPAAGAIIDDISLQRSKEAKLDLQGSLENNDSHVVFRALNDAIITGPTGTNVNDITMVLLDIQVVNIKIE